MTQNQVMERETVFADLAERLNQMAEMVRSAGDEEGEGKYRQLVAKVEQKELCIAFCGHFSAGKSTMVNSLLGKPLLPSNPIPTSANVVKIRGGEPAARVYTRNSGILTFDPETEMDTLKQYAVDGDTVEWVEVSVPGLFLGENASLLDTPGIDSTDAAHKIATESALHLADVVVYMMDYNHVLAEENFHFTKMCQDRGKPVYLVINMIDKHVDFELDFDSYKESVEDAFATWNIRPDGVFYTSLAEPDHPENQYEQFRAKLSELIDKREELVAASVRQSALHLVTEHERFLARKNAERRRVWEEQLAQTVPGVNGEDSGEVQRALAELTAKVEEAESRLAAARDHMSKELDKLLDNARLAYYSTNEAAERYLESRKPNFKVGVLFSGKKTEAERLARLEALLADFREKVSSNLDFHFKQLLTAFPETYGLRDEAYHASVDATRVEVTADLLASQVKPGAGTREYVLHYCNDVANAIKAEYRRIGHGFIDQVVARLAERTNRECAEWRSALAQLRKLWEAHQSLAELAQAEREAGERLRGIMQEGA